MADHEWWQYWMPKTHPNLRVEGHSCEEFDVDKMRWSQQISFSAFFEVLGVLGEDLRRLNQTAVYKFDIVGEGCDAFVDQNGNTCMAKTAYHESDADGVKQMLQSLVGNGVEVETFVNGPKPYVWVFRCPRL